MDLSISNIINVSVSEVGAGIGNYNTSNLALFTDETAGGTFPAAGYALYLSPDQVAIDFGSSSKAYKMALAVFSQTPNILANSGYLVIFTLLSLETLDAALVRTKGLVQYFGAMSAEVETQAHLLAAAAILQADNKLGFFGSRTSADIDTGGKLDLLRSGSFTHSRGLYYGAAADIDLLVEQASYAGRALSTNFEGSNTTQTMHMKDLNGVQPDPTMTETLLAKAKAAGADIYASFQGVAKVFTSGANQFFDDVYNQLWFVGALKVAGFNLLAKLSTKLPQTEDGITSLKGAYRQVCEQAVANQYAAPGTWTSPTTFGNQADFLANIEQRGYYIYSVPVAQQSAASREARQAPFIQIAIKLAGAVHSSDAIVNINK